MSKILDSLKIIGSTGTNLIIKTNTPSSDMAASGYHIVLGSEDNNGFLIVDSAYSGILADNRYALDKFSNGITESLWDNLGNIKTKFSSISGNTSYINNGGNFGIGTASPTFNLEIKASAANDIILGLTPTSGISAMLFEFDTNSPLIGLFNTSGTRTVSLSANSESYFTGGSVGIGTNSPVAKLQLRGIDDLDTSFSFRANNLSGVRALQVTNAGNVLIGDIGSGYYSSALVVRPNTASQSGITVGNFAGTRIYFNNTEDTVTAGHIKYSYTTNSASIGDAAGFNAFGLNIVADGQFILRGKSDSGSDWIEMYTDGSNNPIIYMGNGAGTPALVLHTGGNSYVQGVTGNFGIGTTTPAEKLEVSGNTKITGRLGLGGADTHSSFAALISNAGRPYGIGMTVDGTIGGNGLLLRANIPAQTGFSGDFGDIVSNNAGTGLRFYINTVEAMRITSGSTPTFGIGTASPVAKLDVRGNTSDSTAYVFVLESQAGLSILETRNDGYTIFNGQQHLDADFIIRSNASLNLFVADSGANNIGIGIAAAIAKLDVRSNTSDNTSYILELANSTAQSAIEVRSDCYTLFNALGLSTGDVLIRGSGATSLLFTDSSSNLIGIGNDTPLSKLDILGSNGYTQFRMRTAYTPTGNGDTNGNSGDVAWDESYIYIKTAAAGWGRVALDFVF